MTGLPESCGPAAFGWANFVVILGVTNSCRSAKHCRKVDTLMFIRFNNAGACQKSCGPAALGWANFVAILGVTNSWLQ
jgi:hypothetical protein